MRLNGEIAIIEFLGWDKYRYQKHRKQMKDDGVLHYEMKGRPAHKRVFAFSNRIEIWLIEQSKQGKVF